MNYHLQHVVYVMKVLGGDINDYRKYSSVYNRDTKKA